ncbi:hypothetical protein LPB248_00470 [Flavobacterium sp. LPB0248]|uniref:hypothetical protein n=1 Tax=Flavobacterium sp. LPB0248 TaxID=2614441 RepID=UPI0015A70061|nr:hypothetical protein [Flavobacterium sp. LPB0248]QLC64803.1 hypothetical protein LPB248_00470 [Flavobacterium sp. LPB0248]
MKKTAILLFCLAGFKMCSQTSSELIGKWILIKWTERGRQKDIHDYYKTNQVFQVFKENGLFQFIVGDKKYKGRWEISRNNDKLIIVSGVFTTVYSIALFDSERRIETSDGLGTFEYEKVR